MNASAPSSCQAVHQFIVHASKGLLPSSSSHQDLLSMSSTSEASMWQATQHQNLEAEPSRDSSLQAEASSKADSVAGMAFAESSKQLSILKEGISAWHHMDEKLKIISQSVLHNVGDSSAKVSTRHCPLSLP